MTAAPVKVKGFRHARAPYPWALLWLARYVFADQVDPVHEPSLWDLEPEGEPDRCEVALIREPHNKADTNAIRVEVPVLAEGGFPTWVGYVEREVAAVYADRMDRGMKPLAWVAAIPVKSPAELSTPGLRVYVDWDDS